MNKHQQRSQKVIKVCKTKELEPTFIKIIIKKRRNLILGCIYKHPTLNNQGFINSFMLLLSEKLSYENKQFMLMGDFNTNFLNYNTNKRITKFVDELYTNSFIPYINLPTRITN